MPAEDNMQEVEVRLMEKIIAFSEVAQGSDGQLSKMADGLNTTDDIYVTSNGKDVSKEVASQKRGHSMDTSEPRPRPKEKNLKEQRIIRKIQTRSSTHSHTNNQY